MEALGEASSRGIKKAGSSSFGGTEFLPVTQLMSNNCGAAGRRPGRAWGSLPGRLAARICVLVLFAENAGRSASAARTEGGVLVSTVCASTASFASAVIALLGESNRRGAEVAETAQRKTQIRTPNEQNVAS